MPGSLYTKLMNVWPVFGRTTTSEASKACAVQVQMTAQNPVVVVDLTGLIPQGVTRIVSLFIDNGTNPQGIQVGSSEGGILGSVPVTIISAYTRGMYAVPITGGKVVFNVLNVNPLSSYKQTVSAILYNQPQPCWENSTRADFQTVADSAVGEYVQGSGNFNVQLPILGQPGAVLSHVHLTMSSIGIPVTSSTPIIWNICDGTKPSDSVVYFQGVAIPSQPASTAILLNLQDVLLPFVNHGPVLQVNGGTSGQGNVAFNLNVVGGPYSLLTNYTAPST